MFDKTFDNNGLFLTFYDTDRRVNNQERRMCNDTNCMALVYFAHMRREILQLKYVRDHNTDKYLYMDS